MLLVAEFIHEDESVLLPVLLGGIGIRAPLPEPGHLLQEINSSRPFVSTIQILRSIVRTMKSGV